MSHPVAFFSAKAANQGVDLIACVARVLDRHWYVLGQEVSAFERAFADYCGAAHCVGLANGSDALELALRAAGVGPGDSVMLAANAGFYGSAAARLVGATPHYLDVDAQTLTLSSALLAAALQQQRPKAIIATHLYGQLADIEAIAAVAQSHGVPLIEDCAQAHGASRQGRRAGSFGDIGCFSFYPTKNLGALGDGGAVVCASAALAATVRALRQYGWGRKYHNDIPHGRNSRLDEIQAAVLNDKLAHLDAANAQRRAVAGYYQAALAGLPLLLPTGAGSEFVAHLYVVRTPRRDALRDFLAGRGIATEVHYPRPDHRQQAYPSPSLDLPVTEQACATVLSLPCYPGIAQQDLQAVAGAIGEFFAAANPP